MQMNHFMYIRICMYVYVLNYKW